MNEIEEYADDGDDGEDGEDGDDGDDGDDGEDGDDGDVGEEEEEGGHKHVRIPGTRRVKTPGSDAFAFASRNFHSSMLSKLSSKSLSQ